MPPPQAPTALADVSRKKPFLKGIWRDILFSMERYFYGRLEKCCLEIKHVLLSICPEAKWVQGYFTAWDKAVSPGLLKYSIHSSHHPGPSPVGTGQSFFISWFPPHTHNKTSPGQMCIPSLKAEPEHSKSQWFQIISILSGKSQCHKCTNVFKKASLSVRQRNEVPRN